MEPQLGYGGFRGNSGRHSEDPAFDILHVMGQISRRMILGARGFPVCTQSCRLYIIYNSHNILDHHIFQTARLYP